MAGDWIKMRVWLRRDPRVATMSDLLATNRDFMDWVTDPVQRSCEKTVHEHITSDVTRCITVTSLLEIWGVARDRGDRIDDDLALKFCDVHTLDDICGVPGIGAAMEYVGWVAQEESIRDGKHISLIRFVNFFKEEESPEDRYKRNHAKAQAAYRSRQREKGDEKVIVTRDVTVTPIEEKRREEHNEGSPPIPTARAAAQTLTVADLMVDGVEEGTATEFLALRKRKRAPLTKRALDGIKAEAAKAAWSLEAALDKCLARGWQSFEADWVASQNGARASPVTGLSARDASRKAVADAIWNPNHGHDDDSRTIDITSAPVG